MTNESQEFLCFRHDHTTWQCRLHGPAVPQTFHHTACDLPLPNFLVWCFFLFLWRFSYWESHFVLFPDWFWRLWWAILLLISHLSPKSVSSDWGSIDQVFLFLPSGFPYFFSNAFLKCSLNPNYHDVPQFCWVDAFRILTRAQTLN